MDKTDALKTISLSDEEKLVAEKKQIRTRHLVHLGFSFLLFLIVILFDAINDATVVSLIFKVASYTYGPLLGLYSFGLFVKSKTVKDKWVPVICIIAPLICFLISKNSKLLLGDYVIDNELIIINGLLTFVGLLLISKPALNKESF